MLDGPAGKADDAEVDISNGGVVLSVTWRYGGPAAHAAAALLRGDAEMRFSSPDSPAYGSKALPHGRLFVELGAEDSSVRVVYDLK